MILKFAWGGAPTSMFCTIVSLQPPAVVTICVTVYIPAFEYVCMGFICILGLFPLNEVPSPNIQVQFDSKLFGKVIPPSTVGETELVELN